MTTLNSLLLDIAGVGAVVAGVFVITSKNPVLSVLFLIAVFINVAAFLVLHGTTYLGLAYIIIYVGAIAILFLFVIMMLNIKTADLVSTGGEYAQNLPLGTVLVVLFAWEMLSILPDSATWSGIEAYLGIFTRISNYFDWFNTDVAGLTLSSCIPVSVVQVFPYALPDGVFSNFSQIESIGMGLYTHLLAWLLGTSVILLLSMVGPIVLCMESQPSVPEMDNYFPSSPPTGEGGMDDEDSSSLWEEDDDDDDDDSDQDNTYEEPNRY